MTARIVPIECQYDTNGRVVVYYLAGPTPTLIDTGGAGHPESVLRPALQQHGGDLAAIKQVINTHGHWDHAGGNTVLRDVAGAQVAIHEHGAGYLYDHEQHLAGYYTAAARAMGQPAVVAAQVAGFGDVFGQPHEPDYLLRDGDEIDLGDGMIWRVLNLPGHSADAIALWWEAEGVLIAGDIAQGTGSRPGGAPLYFDSPAQSRQSIARLQEIPFKTLHTSHPFGRLSTPERVAEYDHASGQTFLAESVETLDLLETAFRQVLAVNQGSSDFPTLARQTVAQLQGETRWPLTVDPASGVPVGFAPTLYQLWQEIS